MVKPMLFGHMTIPFTVFHSDKCSHTCRCVAWGPGLLGELTWEVVGSTKSPQSINLIIIIIINNNNNYYYNYNYISSIWQMNDESILIHWMEKWRTQWFIHHPSIINRPRSPINIINNKSSIIDHLLSSINIINIINYMGMSQNLGTLVNPK
jgi:hypothetical protein